MYHNPIFYNTYWSKKKREKRKKKKINLKFKSRQHKLKI